MKRSIRVFSAALVLVGAVAVGTGSAGAEPTYANYKGKTIDLSVDWEGAQACAVLEASIECYDSQAELESALGSGSETSAATSSLDTVTSYCLGNSTLWLTLYDDTSFGGRSLNFRDAGIWQNLSAYTFDNSMASWVNNTYCDALAAWDANGGGSWLTMTARSSSANVGSTWNNNASSIYIYTS